MYGPFPTDSMGSVKTMIADSLGNLHPWRNLEDPDS